MRAGGRAAAVGAELVVAPSSRGRDALRGHLSQALTVRKRWGILGHGLPLAGEGERPVSKRRAAPFLTDYKRRRRRTEVTMGRRSLFASLLAGIVLAAAPSLASAEEPPPRAYENGAELSQTAIPIVAWGLIQLESSVLGKIHCLNTFFAQGWNQHEHFEGSKPIRGYGEVLGWGNSNCEAPEEKASLEVAHKKEIEEGRIEVPLTVTATAEMPLEKIGRQAEICKEEKKTLAQCSAKNSEGVYTERETKLLTAEFHRRVVTLPWKVELIRGEREEEAGTMQKIGLHEYGESGTANESKNPPSPAHSTKCYPKESERPASFKVLPSGCIGVNILFPQIPAEFIFYGTQEIWGINGVKNGLSPSRLHFLEAGTLFSTEGLEGEGSTTGEVKLVGANGVELLTAK
jgi:hypothetical protein